MSAGAVQWLAAAVVFGLGFLCGALFERWHERYRRSRRLFVHSADRLARRDRA